MDAELPVEPNGSRLIGLIHAMRPRQWLKNALVVAAPLAAGKLTDVPVASRTIIAFVAFSLAASGTYLLNDANDVDADRRHPTKRNRPIAAGIVPVRAARGFGVILLAGGLATSAAASRGLVTTVVAYLVLTAAYTLWLKDQPVLDIVAVAAGFVLRALAGAAATNLPISEWFFIVTSFGALLMVTGKREGERKELQGDAASIRPTLGVYTDSYLLFLRSVASGVVLIGYCLWAFESAHNSVTTDSTTIFFQLSILPFSVAILRYALLIDQGAGGEPETLVLRDRPLQIAAAAWAIIYTYGVYVAGQT
ncbi:MAG: decaprenyl-phosphate phosphoribosyltransferase [Acidimicrobiales bacterium]|nr:decaprenyl-phosphate phosphoribosyltransferase [Acidimicrobiales bacterium]